MSGWNHGDAVDALSTVFADDMRRQSVALESIAASLVVIASDITERREWERAAYERKLEDARNERSRLLGTFAGMDDQLAVMQRINRALTPDESERHKQLCNRMDEIGERITTLTTEYPDLDAIKAAVAS